MSSKRKSKEHLFFSNVKLTLGFATCQIGNIPRNRILWLMKLLWITGMDTIFRSYKFIPHFWVKKKVKSLCQLWIKIQAQLNVGKSCLQLSTGKGHRPRQPEKRRSSAGLQVERWALSWPTAVRQLISKPVCLRTQWELKLENYRQRL